MHPAEALAITLTAGLGLIAGYCLLANFASRILGSVKPYSPIE